MESFRTGQLCGYHLVLFTAARQLFEQPARGFAELALPPSREVRDCIPNIDTSLMEYNRRPVTAL